MSNHVLHRSYITIGALPGGCDLTEEVRALNAAGVRIPWAWTITHERLDPNATDQNALTVGVNNGVGAVEYEEGDRTYVPTIGTNSDWVTYHFGGAEETGLPPFSEVPIDTVYQVLTEFIVTRTRPTCVDWREAAPFESQFG